MKNNRNFILLLLFIYFSCNDYDDSCNNPSWIKDDCGICRECMLQECSWNANQDLCGTCFGNNSSCSGCMDDFSEDFDSLAIFHDQSYCYDYEPKFISITYNADSSNIEINPNNNIYVRPNVQNVYFTHNLENIIQINIENFDTISVPPLIPYGIIFSSNGGYQYSVLGYNVSQYIFVTSYE